MAIKVSATPAYLTRASGVLPQNADYTWMFWMRTPHIMQPSALAALGGSDGDGVDIGNYLVDVHAMSAHIYALINHLNQNAWYHFALVRSSNVLKIYVDGVLFASITQSISGRASATQQRLGAAHNAGLFLPVDAELIYNREWTVALSAGQIQAEANAGSAVTTTGLWADHPLTDENTLTDASGNGRHWTATGTFVGSTASPPITVPMSASATTGTSATISTPTVRVIGPAVASTTGTSATIAAPLVRMIMPAVNATTDTSATLGLGFFTEPMALTTPPLYSLRGNELRESPLRQGADESIKYSVVVVGRGSPVQSGAVRLYRLPSMTDVTSTNLAANITAEYSETSISVPTISGLTEGAVYRLEVKTPIGSNIYEWFAEIYCIR